MEELDLRKKRDIETAKAKLDDTKQKLTETLSRISKTESEYQEAKVQWSKKIKNLQNINGTQSFRITKLNGDIENLTKVLQTRNCEEQELRKTNAELQEELVRCKEGTVNMEKEFVKEIEELEGKINMGYVQIQTDKDEEVLLEVGMASIKNEGQVPFLEEVLKKRRDARMARQEEIDTELRALDKSQKQVENDIKQRMEELASRKSKYANLFKEYTITKKARRAI